MRAPLTLLLALPILFLAPALPAQKELREAQRDFKRAADDDDLSVRRAALDALVETGEVRALRDVRRTLSRLDRELERHDKRVATLGRKREEIWDGVDKQAASGRPVSVGTVEPLIKKDQELTAEQAEALKARTRELLWREALLEGAGRLIANTEDPAEHVDDLMRDIGRERDTEEILAGIAILAASGRKEARQGLVELLATHEDGRVRTAAADGLGEIGDVEAAEVLGRGLKDDHWTVRVAAARALARLGDLDAVPPLLARLDQTAGRTQEEIIASLEDLTGQSFFDNATLWRDWWKNAEEGLRGNMAELRSDSTAKRMLGLSGLGNSGLLIGIDPALELVGLGEGAASFTEKGQVTLVLDSVGRAIATRKEHLRERAVGRHVLERLRATGEVHERDLLLRLLGRVPSERARRILSSWSGPNDARTPEGRTYDASERETLREAAIAALGFQGHPDAVAPLTQVLDTFRAPVPRKVLAAESLGRLAVREAVPPLINALTSDHEEIVTAATESLKNLTGVDHGRDYEAWRDWWRAEGETFTPKGGAAVVADAEEGPKTGGFYGIDTRSQHLVFIIDRSGSMTEADAGQSETRWQVARKELVQAIRGLKEEASFNIVFYNHEFAAWKKEMTQATTENRAEAVRWIEEIRPMGNTNIFDPLAFALELARRGQDGQYGPPLDTVFFLSDGQPNRGKIIHPDEIVREIDRLNEAIGIRIHTIGVGRGHSEGLMRRLAEMTGGTYVAR